MIHVLRSGISSIQDQGRTGFRHHGVPISGAMDYESLRIGNLMLGNSPSSAAIEVTLLGPKLRFTKDTFIVVSGATCEVLLNGEPIAMHTVIRIQADDILDYRRILKGSRSYLCVKDGIRTPLVLGSRSYASGITPDKKLHKNDDLEYIESSTFTPILRYYERGNFLSENIIDVSHGPEYNSINPTHINDILNQRFTISKDCSRMGYRLTEEIGGHDISMLTSATLPGTVQYTPAGKLIILMKDGPTTGGYPRLFQLSEKALSIIAQKKEGDSIRFRMCL